uniref:Ig-like domain-containing protein n=1 Tax=Taeniopygia guttata TaxID=59729 RepID=H0ZZY6_TAEGU
MERVCISTLKEPIQSDTITVATLGGEANFYCNFSLSVDVLQVTWQKRNGTSFQNMATYSPKHGLRLIGPFQKKVSFTRAAPKASAITLQNLTLEDDSYYRCIFNVFHHGSFSKDIRLNIQSKFSTNTFSLSGTQFGSDVLRRQGCHYTIHHMEIFHAAASPWWIVSRLPYQNYYLTNCPFDCTVTTGNPSH